MCREKNEPCEYSFYCVRLIYSLLVIDATNNIYNRQQLKEDKTLDEEAFKQYVVKEVATQDYQQAVAEEVATKCAEIAKQPSGDNPDGGDESKCAKTQLKAMKCVMKEFFEACPADLQDQAEHCKKMREMVKSGEFKRFG